VSSRAAVANSVWASRSSDLRQPHTLSAHSYPHSHTHTLACAPAGKAQPAAGQTDCIECASATEAGVGLCPCAEGYAREDGGMECVCKSPDPPPFICPCLAAVRKDTYKGIHTHTQYACVYVRVCVCVRVSVCVNTNTHEHTRTHIHTQTHSHKHKHTHLHTCIYTYMYEAHVCVYIYMNTYSDMYTDVCVGVYN